MDSSWFDIGVVDDVVGIGFPSRRRERDLIESRSRFTSIASSRNVSASAAASSSVSFLEESRSLDLDLQATSARLRDAARFAIDDSHGDIIHETVGLSTRRLQFAQRFNDLLRRNSIVDDVVSPDRSRLQDEVNQQRGRLKCLEEKYRDHIAVLEFQVKAHKDDWEAERSEKQQMMKDKTAAEAKVRQLQKDVRCLKLKLKEERLENANYHCVCCASNSATEQVTNLSPSIKDQNKMYRTSVHLPCSSLPGHPVIPKKETTLLVVDDDEENAPTVDACASSKPTLNAQVSPDGFLRSRSNSDEESLLSFTEIILKPIESKIDPDPHHRPVLKRSGLPKPSFYDSTCKNTQEQSLVSEKVPKQTALAGNATKVGIVYQSASQPNLTSPTTLSCSVLHITPCPVESASESSVDGSSGVTIGYSSNGLASVCSFPQTPIVKSYSLPTSRVADKMTSFECEFPVSQPSSLDSSWSVLPNNDQLAQTYATSSDSLFEERKTGKLSILGAFAKSMKQSKECVADNKNQLPGAESSEHTSTQNTAMWKAKYFEHGVDTQSAEDLMCPTCSQIFPLNEHVKFLDHFEKCQTIKKEVQSFANHFK